MKRKILFIIGSLLNFLMIPYICFHTVEGEKGDLGMAIVFGLIPMGLALLSFLWGLFCPRKIELLFSPLCAEVMGLLVIITVEVWCWMSGMASPGFARAICVIGIAVFLIAMVATLIGYLIRSGILFLTEK